MASTGAKIIFWTLGAAAVGGLGYWLYKTYGGGKKVKLTQEEIDKMISDAKASGEIKTTTPNETVNVVSESFPLSVGMTGEKIKALQVKLGVSPTTGYFGNKTNAAVQAKGYTIPLSEANYNKIMGVTVTTTTGAAPLTKPKEGDSVYILKDVVIKKYPSAEYAQEGILKKSRNLVTPIGTLTKLDKDGYVKIALKNAGGEKFINNVREVYTWNETLFIKASDLSLSY